MHTTEQTAIIALTDKDCQQFSKTYRHICELFYQNTKDKSNLETLIHLTQIIPGIIENKMQSNALTIVSQLQILKAKAKSEAMLKQSIQKAIQHLRRPFKQPIDVNNVVQILKRNQAFHIGCLIIIRFFKELSKKQEINSKAMFQAFGGNLLIEPSLAVEALQLLCSSSEQNCRLLFKQGIVKSLFLNYLPKILKSKLQLYKSIKLLTIISKSQKSIVRQRQKMLALILYTYQQYIPTISGICQKCFDVQYCQQIDQQKPIQSLDQLYLWSYTKQFCLEIMNSGVITHLNDLLKKSKLSVEVQSKIIAIIDNYCRYCEYADKELIKKLPNHPQSLLNYLKMCFTLTRLDNSMIKLIDWPALDQLVASTSDSKILQLHKMLKQLTNKSNQVVGTLNQSLVSMFSMQKNADILNERASRIPKNNNQVEDIRQILKQTPKAQSTQFDKDNLTLIKQKALNSLHTGITKGHNLNLNPLLAQWNPSNVELTNRLLQCVELNLVMHEDAVDKIDSNKILQMIRALEENYDGEIVDWGVVVQILSILFEPGEWVKHVKKIPKDCFWLLQIDELSEKDQKLLFSTLQTTFNSDNMRKIAMIIGFLGKNLTHPQKLQLLKKFKPTFDRLNNQISQNKNYKLNLMMLSYFIKGWNLQQGQQNYKQNNKQFQKFIRPLVDIVVSMYRALPQQHHFLQSCLPYKIHPHSLSNNISQLISSNGKLSAYLYQNQPKGKKTNITSDSFSSLSHSTPAVLLENLQFLAQNPSSINMPELQRLLQRLLNNKNNFWDLYPHYVSIISLMMFVLGSGQPSIKPHLTQNLTTLVNQIQGNKDIQPQQKIQLLQDFRDTLGQLKEKGSYIQIETVKKVVNKIVEEEIRQEIIYILNDYQVKQPPPVKVIPVVKSITPVKVNPIVKQEKIVWKKQPITQQETYEPKNQTVTQKAQQKQLIKEANLESFSNNLTQNAHIEVPEQKKVQSIEMQFQSVKHQTSMTTFIQALQMLKKIVDKQQPTSKFNQLYPLLEASHPKQAQRELLGSLLAKYYPMQQDQRALNLLLNKDLTSLAKQSFQQLIRRHIPAFKLVRRWKIQSLQGLDLAMQRINQGFFNDSCVVAAYNLKLASHLQYFHKKQYHKVVISSYKKAISEDQIVHYLTLVGGVAKLPQIKEQFIANSLHTNIMPLNKLFPESVRVNSSLCYAQSTLSFEKPQACLEIISCKPQLDIIYNCLRKQPINKTLVQPGVCLIANLSYSSIQIKQLLRQRGTIQLLILLFEKNLINPDRSIYKQLLRSMGNLSMSKQCSEELIMGHFSELAVRMAEILDFFVMYDENKARAMKLLLDLVSNLAAHRTKLQIMHKEKITLLIITMLQTIQSNAQLLAACIDTIDALCQSPQIQLYMVSQKRLLYVLMDILKQQEQMPIMIKAARLVCNLSIHSQCIPFILSANVLSVIGNVVVPNLYVGCMEQTQAKRVQGYILKILQRIYSFKPQLPLILKSGFLDCLVRTIQLVQVQDSHLQILFSYSNHLPTFLNKRAFSCLMRVLINKVGSNEKAMVQKCIISFKNILTFSYNRDNEEEVIQKIPQMYEKILKNQQYFVDGLFLLVYHLLRSHGLRKMLAPKGNKLSNSILNLGKDETYFYISRAILFLIHNPPTPLYLPICDHKDSQKLYAQLRQGFKCRLFRSDGSSKQAKLDVDNQYNLRAYKAPDGEVKSKYTININHIRDIQLDFQNKEQLWSHTVFALDPPLLQSRAQQRNCMTMIGSSRWGQIKMINVEFTNDVEKVMFYSCLSSVLMLFN